MSAATMYGTQERVRNSRFKQSQITFFPWSLVYFHVYKKINFHRPSIHKMVEKSLMNNAINIVCGTKVCPTHLSNREKLKPRSSIDFYCRKKEWTAISNVQIKVMLYVTSIC